MAWLTIAVVLAAAIGAIWARGGLAAVDPPAPALTMVSVGEPIDLGPATFKVSHAVARSELEGLFLDTEKLRFLAIVVMVTVTDNETFGGAAEALELTGVDGIETPKADRVLLARDAQYATGLQPGLPEEVVYLWEQSKDAAIPPTVTVTFRCATRYEAEQTPGHTYYFEDACAQATIELENETVTVTPTP